MSKSYITVTKESACFVQQLEHLLSRQTEMSTFCEETNDWDDC